MTCTQEMDHVGPSQQPQINANEARQPMMNGYNIRALRRWSRSTVRGLMGLIPDFRAGFRATEITNSEEDVERNYNYQVNSGLDFSAMESKADQMQPSTHCVLDAYGVETPPGDHAVLEQGEDLPLEQTGAGESVSSAATTADLILGAITAPKRGAKSAATRAGSTKSIMKRARMGEKPSDRRSELIGVGDGANCPAPNVPTSTQEMATPGMVTASNGNGADVPTTYEMAAPGMVTGSNGNEGVLAQPERETVVVSPQLDVVLEQGANTSDGDSQSDVTSVENEVLPQGGPQIGQEKVLPMTGGMVGEAVATTSANPRGSQPARRRPRQPKDHHHGVRKREGCSGKFVADFRPSNLPESDKRWAVVGEFDHESDAWNAFNLMAFVHEGEEATINADIESIAVEAEEWKDRHQVDLLAHLRLRGRGFWEEFGTTPKYRSVRKVVSRGKVRWNCNITVNKNVVDPARVTGKNLVSTFDTAEEAAKEVDRRNYLNEGEYAWTNFAVTDYMTDPSQLDKTWLPLTDHPKKYLEGF